MLGVLSKQARVDRVEPTSWRILVSDWFNSSELRCQPHVHIQGLCADTLSLYSIDNLEHIAQHGFASYNMSSQSYTTRYQNRVVLSCPNETGFLCGSHELARLSSFAHSTHRLTTLSLASYSARLLT